MKFKYLKALLVVTVLSMARTASAGIITYEYEFSTPTFDAPGFEQLSDAFGLLGPNISGTFSYDNAAPTRTYPTYQYFSIINATNNLGTGWTSPSSLRASLTGDPERILYFIYNAPDTGDRFSFAMDFKRSIVFALTDVPFRDPNENDIADCLEFGSCTEQISQYINTNFTIEVQQKEVPEPSTLAIFALGMIGLASRRFKKQS